MLDLSKPTSRRAICLAMGVCMAFFGGAVVADSALAHTIKVGIIPIGDLAQIYVAKEKGFFKEAGLSVELHTMAGGAVIAPAVASGDLDIGFSNVISIIQAHEKGFDFIYLTSGAHETPRNRVHAVLAAKGAGIKSMKDLEGKTVGVNTRRNLLELVFTAWADRQGATITEIKFIEAPFPQMEPALKRGSIAAAMVVEPFLTLPLRHGVADVMIRNPMSIFGARMMIASYFTRKSWIKKWGLEARFFTAVIKKASRYINEHLEEMPGIIAANTKLTLELAKKITLPAFSPTFRKSDLQGPIDLAAKYGFIKKRFDASELISKYATVAP